MSNPFSASENTASALPVRSEVLSSEGENVPPPSQAGPRTITFTGIPPPARAKRLPLLPGRIAAYNEEQPQLTERDSIFATNYLSSDSTATTPRLRPAQEGANTSAPTSQDDAAMLALPNALFPQSSNSAMYPYETRSSPSITAARSSEKDNFLRHGPSQRSQSIEGMSRMPSQKQRYDREGDLETIVPEGDPFISPSYRNPAEETPRSSTGTLGLSRFTRMSTLHDEAAAEINRTDGNVGEGLEDANDGRWSVDRTRSSSRSRHAHVDKSIEATIATAEPAVNARSRKASHYLGLFKENTGPQGPNQGQDRIKTPSTTRGGGGSTKEPGNAEAQPDSGFARRHDDWTKSIRDSRASSAAGLAVKHSDDVRADVYPMPETLAADGTGSTLPQNVSARPDSTRSLSDASKESCYGDETVTVSPASRDNAGYGSKKAGEAGLPLRLLQEIRNHHNLAPPFHDKFRTPHAKFRPLGDSAVDSEATSPTSKGYQSSAAHDQLKKSDAASTEEDDDDSDKEQISSALYYPHQAPNLNPADGAILDETDEHGSPDQGVTIMESDTQSLTDRLGDKDLTPSKKIDIALQSRETSRCLHGDLQRPRAPSSELQTKPYESGTSSASESDYESWDETAQASRGDESSHANDAETTPTATPTPYAPILHEKGRRVHRASDAPLGAVELKPFNHQVGGHTTVFRFSKRAVCKQLSNRENEFYEVIERRHPEMLRFLPRYAWFLMP